VRRPSRIGIVHATLLVFAILLLGQAARIQLVQGEMWAERARRQQFRVGPMVAPRGKILDASGNVLAESRELLRINVAPQEVKNTAALAGELRKAGFDAAAIGLATDRARKWVTLPGLHVSTEVTGLTAIAGVHPETVVKREYVSAPGIRRVVGALDASGRAVAGIELALDSVLAGDSTRAPVARDVRGRRLDSPESWLDEPRSGSNVTLTINRDLQEICERALARAADSLDAAGGDIVVVNPVTGEVLAMASLRRGRPSFSATAVTEPFEPGSTLKPFVAAALLERRRAAVEDVVPTFGGQMKIGPRVITDLHKAQQLSLADVIRFSSNIGIVQFGSRLTPRETFETLRDLGFGTATGVPIPGEANGTLREPARWQAPSAASLAMGYEIAVTPLQLVTAYSALANGGQVMQPHIIREIRLPDGELVYRARPRVMRRVFSEEVAREVRSLLITVVDSGTAMRADLATFQLAGKSGTARRTEGGRYVTGNYTASFVGLFPADKPQYVVLVKLDSPRRAFYGGEVAAPVSAVVLRAAIAARDAALDRGDLASVERDLPAFASDTADSADQVEAPRTSVVPAETFGVDPGPYEEKMRQPARTIALPLSRAPAARAHAPQAVPEVAHLSTRNAVRALHKAGFRVTLSSSQIVPTIPAAGSVLPPGSIVKLRHID
jgi:cell division protein FtsI (penicillin-binding protein 3)